MNKYAYIIVFDYSYSDLTLAGRQTQLNVRKRTDYFNSTSTFQKLFFDFDMRSFFDTCKNQVPAFLYPATHLMLCIKYDALGVSSVNGPAWPKPRFMIQTANIYSI